MKIFVLTYKNPFKQAFYTTLAAVFEENTKEELRVSKFKIDRIDFTSDIYENEVCKIETAKVKKRQDIIREREQFL